MSSARVSNSIPLPSPLKFEKDAAKLIEKQGIVSILGSEFEVNKVAPSLRRTISADMSSKKWLAQNGFSSMKRIASSGELAAASASLPEGDEDDDELNIPGQDDVWRSIQLQKEKNEHTSTVWSSILTEKTNESNNLELPPPYIHPLLKRSASILSEKSLEICTESLGSETGSEGFSSHPASETGDIEDNKDFAEQQQEEKAPQTQYSDEFEVAKYNYKPGKKMASRSFPPPLPSLARGNGSSLHMQTRRESGRLVLQAVSVPQRNYFKIERQQGRLLLTLQLEPNQEEMTDTMFGQLFDNCEEVEKHKAIVEEEYDYEEKEGEDEEEEHEQSSRSPSGDVINAQRSTLMMKSFMGLHNKDPTWSSKLNRAVDLMEVEEMVDKHTPIFHPATMKTASTYNTYEYIWRSKPSMASIIDPVTQQSTPLIKDNNKVVLTKKINSERENGQHGMVLTRGNKADYMVPFLMRGCKENTRSLLFWQQPHCVATS